MFWGLAFTAITSLEGMELQVLSPAVESNANVFLFLIFLLLKLACCSEGVLQLLVLYSIGNDD